MGQFKATAGVKMESICQFNRVLPAVIQIPENKAVTKFLEA